jgi:hypothetical protein
MADDRILQKRNDIVKNYFFYKNYFFKISFDYIGHTTTRTSRNQKEKQKRTQRRKEPAKFFFAVPLRLCVFA